MSYSSEDGFSNSLHPLLWNSLTHNRMHESGMSEQSTSAPIVERLLREVKGENDQEQIRKQWHKISGAKFDATESDHPAGSLSLLKSVTECEDGGVEAEFSVIDDPVDSQLVTVSIPKEMLAYGGQLGQWSDETKTQYRLGHVSETINKNTKQRSILRIHLHQLFIMDHPYMNEEERLYVDLRSIYAHYRTLLHQRAGFYLSYRLYGLISAIRKQLSVMSDVGENERDDDEDDDYAGLEMLYKDFLETLPSLLQAQSTLTKLSGSLYDSWKKIKKCRKAQGFVCTRAHLTGRSVQSMEDAGERSSRRISARDREEKETEPSNPMHPEEKEEEDAHPNASTEIEHWMKLMEELETGVDIIEQVQGKLRRHEIDIGGETDSVTSSMLEGGPSKTDSKNRSTASLKKESSISSNIRNVEKQQAQEVIRDENIAKVVGKQIEDLHDILSNGDSSSSKKKRTEADFSKYSFLPKVIFRLSNTGDITANAALEEHYPLEMYRRITMACTTFKAVVKVNGSTLPHMLLKASLHFPSLIAEFNQYLELQVFHEPTDISLELYMKPGAATSSALTDVYLGCIGVPLPHQKSATSGQLGPSSTPLAGSVVPASGWNLFSSALPVKLPALSIATMSNYAYAFVGGKLPPVLPGKDVRVQGAIYCATEYLMSAPNAGQAPAFEALQSTEASNLPAHPISDNHQSSRFPIAGASGLVSCGHSSAQESSGFTAERDFQQLLPPLDLIDIYDPRNDIIRRLKRSASGLGSGDRDIYTLAGNEFLVMHGEDGVPYSNYMKWQLNNRTKLLVLRGLKPYLFTEPVPLLESEIKLSELYRTMISRFGDDKPEYCVLHAGTSHTGHGASAATFGSSMLSTIKEENRRSVTALGAIDEDATVVDDPEEDADDAIGDAGLLYATKGKEKISNFLQQVRDSHTNNDRLAKRSVITMSSVVAEKDYTPYFEPIVNMETLIPPRVRALRPAPKTRIPQALEVRSCNLLVQVVGAKNIPLRKLYSDTNEEILAAKRNKINRNRGSNSNSNDDSLDKDKTTDKLRARTFVEVSFQENTAATTCIEGSSPMWKQSISLPFRVHQNNFSPAKLSQVRDVVYFSVFDEVSVDDAERGGFLEGESTVRLERRFIGSFQLPFSTIYNEGKIEGTFKLHTPLFNFGYEQQTHHSPLVDPRDMKPEIPMYGPVWTPVFNAIGGFISLFDVLYPTPAGPSTLNEDNMGDQESGNEHAVSRSTKRELNAFMCDQNTTYIKLMVTLDPLLATPSSSNNEIVRSMIVPDDGFLIEYAKKWVKCIKSYNKFTETRSFNVFATTSSGLKAFLCHYLTPQEPPSEFNTRRAFIHLISLIPFMADAHAFVGEVDMWCTSKQLWEMASGDEEEHAVMLHNYLLHLFMAKHNKSIANDTPAELYLAIGTAVPEGNGVYVLVKNTVASATSFNSSENRRNMGRGHSTSHTNTMDEYLLINPCNGTIFSANDVNCPMKRIFMLVTPRNIYANVQSEDKPYKCHWDVNNLALWKPFFSPRFPFPSIGLRSIQDNVTYTPTSMKVVLDIEKSVRQQIKNSLRRWRSRRHRSTTTFHPDGCAIMHDLLPMLEEWKRTGIVNKDTGIVDAIDDLQPQTRSRSESGLHSPPGSVDEGSEIMRALQKLVKSKLKSVLKSRSLHGCPFNMPFTDLDDVMAEVKSTCIHESKQSDVQFVLAVRAFPLVNNLVSLWLFLGTLEVETPGNRIT